MEKVNFEPIGEAMQAFDTDKMDIGRRTEVVNPDGTTGETTPDIPIYTEVPCHISFNNVDNPDPNTAETRPIIQALTINCSLDVDLQNGDYITAYKLAYNGMVIETYRGVIGDPTSSMSRKSAIMQVRTDV